MVVNGGGAGRKGIADHGSEQMKRKQVNISEQTISASPRLGGKTETVGLYPEGDAGRRKANQKEGWDMKSEISRVNVASFPWVGTTPVNGTSSDEVLKPATAWQTRGATTMGVTTGREP